MKVHFVEQGTPAWLALRLGIPTASEFDRIVTPTGKLSAQARAYAHRLTAERLLNRPMDGLDHLEWVARGKELEPEAARMYEFQKEAKTVKVGFVTTDDGQTGASPDRLAGDAGLLEIKCPAPHTHIGYLLDGMPADAKYKPQVQGQLLVAEREWTDFMSYSPEMPPAIIRTVRDEPFIRTLRQALDEFNDMREEMYQRALALGAFQVAPQVQTVHEQIYAAEQMSDADEFGSAFA